MRTFSEPIGTQSAVGTRVAYVLGDPEVWPPAFGAALEESGFQTAIHGQLHELFEAARERPASLLVLAQRNGPFAVRACRVIRGLQDIPLMVVMPSESDLIPVLDAGADDAVIARAEPSVFAARVRALIRRAQPASRSGGTLDIRDLTIDFERYQVLMNEEPVALTPTEFRLLAVLAQQAGRVVDPRALLSAVHQHDYSERDAQNLVKVHIANLRRKLNDGKDPDKHPYILCVRGFGYMLDRRTGTRDDDPLTGLLDHE